MSKGFFFWYMCSRKDESWGGNPARFDTSFWTQNEVGAPEKAGPVKSTT